MSVMSISVSIVVRSVLVFLQQLNLFFKEIIMLVKQWKKHYKALCARRARVWANLKPVSAVLAVYQPNHVIHHNGKAY